MRKLNLTLQAALAAASLWTIPAAAETWTLPLDRSPNGLYWAQVSVGNSTTRCLVDTGASTTQLPKGMLSGSDWQASGQETFVMADGSRRAQPLGTVTLTLGRLDIHGVEATVGAQCLLGQTVWANFSIIAIDAKNLALVMGVGDLK